MHRNAKIDGNAGQSECFINIFFLVNNILKDKANLRQIFGGKQLEGIFNFYTSFTKGEAATCPSIDILSSSLILGNSISRALIQFESKGKPYKI